MKETSFTKKLLQEIIHYGKEDVECLKAFHYGLA